MFELLFFITFIDHSTKYKAQHIFKLFLFKLSYCFQLNPDIIAYTFVV